MSIQDKQSYLKEKNGEVKIKTHQNMSSRLSVRPVQTGCYKNKNSFKPKIKVLIINSFLNVQLQHSIINSLNLLLFRVEENTNLNTNNYMKQMDIYRSLKIAGRNNELQLKKKTCVSSRS